jgi:hypothetical protein
MLGSWLLALGSWADTPRAKSPEPRADSQIDDSKRAVETIRGLRFRAPVRVITIDRSELPARLEDQFAKTLPYAADEWEKILRALLLVEERGDVKPSLIALYQSQVLAYYDPLTKTYVALEQLPEAAAALGQAAALSEGIEIHELTHALQDQHFEIGDKSWDLRHDTDAGLAYHAVLEGEATLVMLAHIVEKMGGSFDEAIGSDLLVGTLAAAASSDALMSGAAPPYFSELLKFPYIQGLNFVVAAYRRGGWKELDRIHRNPPRTSREILHPEEYFEKKFVPDVFSNAPAAGVSRTLAVERLGEFHWSFLVGADAARGWKSDRVTIAANAACEPTVLVETQWDSNADAEEFHAAYTRLLEDKGYGSLSRISGSSVRVAYGAERAVMERFIQ